MKNWTHYLLPNPRLSPNKDLYSLMSENPQNPTIFKRNLFHRLAKFYIIKSQSLENSNLFFYKSH